MEDHTNQFKEVEAQAASIAQELWQNGHHVLSGLNESEQARVIRDEAEKLILAAESLTDTDEGRRLQQEGAKLLALLKAYKESDEGKEFLEAAKSTIDKLYDEELLQKTASGMAGEALVEGALSSPRKQKKSGAGGEQTEIEVLWCCVSGRKHPFTSIVHAHTI
eukprot:TRINITY_DN2341_c0_g1_i4.p1 TRINITY_DN2341_c0_g1~~TRINITY_DN2341_c0_g1_i4.p1  ORF type:complete len:164 (-),score=18.59 TRINITY_DN2341_c0_g1_i4:99-590(-)